MAIELMFWIPMSVMIFLIGFACGVVAYISSYGTKERKE